VDFTNGVIRFVRLQNRKPVPMAAPIYGDMGAWLDRQKEFRDKHFPKCEFVFFWYPIDCEIDPTLKAGHGGRRNEPGMPIKSFYDSWREAVKDAGFPDLLFHDLRRSAVRNMVEKIGMSEKRAMEISGHKTRSCFERYHIVSLADIQESGAKMDHWIKKQRTTSAKGSKKRRSNARGTSSAESR
jgi:integrase